MYAPCFSATPTSEESAHNGLKRAILVCSASFQRPGVGEVASHGESRTTLWLGPNCGLEPLTRCEKQQQDRPSTRSFESVTAARQRVQCGRRNRIAPPSKGKGGDAGVITTAAVGNKRSFASVSVDSDGLSGLGAIGKGVGGRVGAEGSGVGVAESGSSATNVSSSNPENKVSPVLLCCLTPGHTSVFISVTQQAQPVGVWVCVCVAQT